MPLPRNFRFAILLASWFVPSLVRTAWRRKWESRLEGWWILDLRGEDVGPAGECIRDMLIEALREGSVADRLRSPMVPFLFTVVGVGVLGLLTQGFGTTRWIYAVSQGAVQVPRPGDVMVGYLSPIVFALATSMAAAIIVGLPVIRGSFLYWLHLLGKTTTFTVAASLLWIEGGAAIRAQIPLEIPRVILGGLLPAAALIAGSTCLVVWILMDQRLRCPVCLSRLTLPVSVGSWASVFEPAGTESVCEHGHGLLCVEQDAGGERHQWTTQLLAGPRV